MTFSGRLVYCTLQIHRRPTTFRSLGGVRSGFRSGNCRCANQGLVPSGSSSIIASITNLSRFKINQMIMKHRFPTKPVTTSLRTCPKATRQPCGHASPASGLAGLRKHMNASARLSFLLIFFFFFFWLGDASEIKILYNAITIYSNSASVFDFIPDSVLFTYR